MAAKHCTYLASDNVCQRDGHNGAMFQATHKLLTHVTRGAIVSCTYPLGRPTVESFEAASIRLGHAVCLPRLNAGLCSLAEIHEVALRTWGGCTCLQAAKEFGPDGL